MTKEKKKQNNKKRKYYEVWGDTLNMMYFLRTLTIILAGLCVFLSIMLQRATNKSPLVVKVDSLGRTQAIKEWESQVRVTRPEIVNFARTFMELFVAYDLYTYDNSFRKAFKMMTPEYQKRADDYLEANAIINSIKEGKLKTTVNIAKIETLKDSPGIVALKIRGYREVRSYANPDFYKEVIFESELVLKKIPRDYDTPYGLLVDNYSETIIKEK